MMIGAMANPRRKGKAYSHPLSERLNRLAPMASPDFHVLVGLTDTAVVITFGSRVAPRAISLADMSGSGMANRLANVSTTAVALLEVEPNLVVDR